MDFKNFREKNYSEAQGLDLQTASLSYNIPFALALSW